MPTRRGVLMGAAAILSPRPARAARRVIDDAGRSVTIPDPIQRVYAAGPPASLLTFALAPEKLLGWTTPWREAERNFVDAKYANLPTLGRLTGRGNTANVETVLAAKPDLIVDYGAVNATYASLADRMQQQTGLPYLLLNGRLDKMAASSRKLGDILGVPEHGHGMADWIDSTLNEIDTRLGRHPNARRPRVYYGRGPRGLDTGLRGSINTELIERIGAVNVAAALGQGGLVTVSVEQVLAWAPDVIITIDLNFYTSLQSDPLWRAIPAVRSGHAYLAPNLPFGWVDFPPANNRVLGLRWLARLLFPELFPDDLRPFVRDAYARLYHRTPDDAQLDALLRSVAPLNP